MDSIMTTFQQARVEALQLSGEARVARGKVFEKLGVRFTAEGDPDLGQACAELGRELQGRTGLLEWESFSPGDAVGNRVIDTPVPAPAPAPVPAPWVPTVRDEMEMLDRGVRVLNGLKSLSPRFAVTQAEIKAVHGAVSKRLPK